MTWNDHDHRGEYAEDRHDHDLDYAEKYHRHHDDESAVRGLREDLGHAEERIRALEDDLRGALAFIRVLDRLRPTCVICRDATADRQTVRGPACTDCVGDLPDDGPDPDRPETWAFGEAPVQPLRPDEASGYVCPETIDGEHTGTWHDGERVRRVRAVRTGRQRRLRPCAPSPWGHPEPSPADDFVQDRRADLDPNAVEAEPEPREYDPGPEVDDEGGMSEHRYYVMPEDYERGQS